MAKEGKVKKEKRGGKAAGIGIIAALLLLGGGLGYSTFGTGSGGGTDTTGPDQNSTVQAQADRSAASNGSDEAQAAVPQTVIVNITEHDVTINGNPVADKAALQDYIKQYNSDSRLFVLEEQEAYKKEYDWVNAAFDELGVKLDTK